MKQFRGIIKSQEQHQSNAIRDIRPIHIRLATTLQTRFGSNLSILMLALLSFLFSNFSDLIFFMIIGVYWFTMYSIVRIPCKKPIFSNEKDVNNPSPGSNKPGESKGIYYFGNEIGTDHELWFNNEDMRTHALIFGSTGSGKTETLLSISYNALAQGSGFIYVDGKGDNSLFAKVFSMTRSLGREDDLLVINFMTGAKDIIGAQKNTLSNTLNPFANGSSSMLSQLVVSMMESGSQGNSDGDMWKGRAISFIESLMRYLVYLRDNEKLLLDAGTIRRYFTLDALENLFYDNKIIDENGEESIFEGIIPIEVSDPLDNYLSSLPGYKKGSKGEQSDKAYEQHGYIIMQLTRIFSSLADVYGHIIKTNLAEVDFKDVILNRRILVVLLPALEKSPDELSNLGKMIVASLRSMLAAGLGDKVEGQYKEIIETKPTNSKSPYLCVLDEYGYYAVKGFAVVPAQARSLGFSVIFAGQDLPAFQKASKEEAASICANTNIKMCMKLEDPQETWEFFQKTAGESYVSAVKGFNIDKNSTSLSYKDSMEANLDKRNRIDILDLKDQREGEAHLFFKSNIVRMKSFYANPPTVKEIRVNEFVKVEPPRSSQIELMKSVFRSRLNPSDYVEARNQYNHDFQIKFQKGLDNGKDWIDANTADHFLQSLISEDINQEDKSLQEEQQNDVYFSSDQIDIFMKVPINFKLEHDLFDVTNLSLEEEILDKEKIIESIDKLGILNDMSRQETKKYTLSVISKIAKLTEYTAPVESKDINDALSDMLEKINE